MIEKKELAYEEKISSNKTAALFLTFTLLFLVLFIWRMDSRPLDLLAVVFLCLFIFFLFYLVNYRTLIIRLTAEELMLTFGIFSWVIPLEEIRSCQLDDAPWMMKMGGAGIHFMFVRKRYRASFNFLQYPRVVITLKSKRGLVQDISFNTRRPDDVLRHLRDAISV
jgi:Ca2+/Na+ antiporter